MDGKAATSGVLYFILTSMIIYSTLISLGIVAHITYKQRRSASKASNFEIVIVSKADSRVKKSLLESVRYHVGRFGRVVVVVDEGAELIPHLRSIKGVKLVVVPSNYRRDLVGKGRALQYFVDCCVDSSKWYVFIDDDNLIIGDDFQHEIPEYERMGYVAANGILVPRPGKSTLAYVMDWIRFIDDLLIYRFFTGLLARPLIGLHGDLLIVKGSVLKEIGFGRRSLTEDFDFAAELVKRGYKTWQSNTKVSIKSPNSLKDLVLQRGRWFKGIISGIRHCPAGMKLVVVLRSFTFGVGFFMLAVILPILSQLGYTWFILPALPGGLYYVGTYTYGAYKAKRLHLMIFAPIMGIIEAMSRLYGLLLVKDYVVIDKN
ncbi:MAG: glycosyltransferase family 2 protein [Desulfurococcaceae archaeon]